MQRDVKAIVDGIVGGGIGTAGMSAFMLAAEKAGLMGEHPPDLIAGAALEAMGIHQRDEEKQDALAVLLHFGFGIGMGALFGLVHRRLPFRVPAALHGLLYGTLVWAASYQGWVPALGIMPPASDDRPDRPRAMLVAHWVYGAILGLVVDRRGEHARDDESSDRGAAVARAID
jgi:hypothetical protein